MLFEKFFLRLCLYDFTFYKPRFFALTAAFLRLKHVFLFWKNWYQPYVDIHIFINIYLHFIKGSWWWFFKKMITIDCRFFENQDFRLIFLKISLFFRKKITLFLDLPLFSGRVMWGKCTCVEFILVGSLWPAWVGRGRVLLASK